MLTTASETVNPDEKALMLSIFTPTAKRSQYPHEKLRSPSLARTFSWLRKPTTDSIKSAKVMIVDDEPINVKVVRKYLETAGFANTISCTDSTLAVQQILADEPDLVLLDIMMPQVSGFDILAQMRSNPRTELTPVVILTASEEPGTKIKALDLGASDFLAKPVDASELRARITNILLIKQHQDQIADYAAQLENEVRFRTAELAVSRQEAIHCLARAAEYRDQQTGYHVLRVGRYAALIADELGFSAEQVALMEQAAQLHDVGKIGIPDAILCKPGKLEVDEFEIMKQHCAYGTEILRNQNDTSPDAVRDHVRAGSSILDHCSSPVMRLAARIAQSHHEKWDGSGYPLGLAGEDIPIEGRITAVADVFDALCSRRPYKEPLSPDTCFAMIEDGRGSHFDPQAVDAFFARKLDIAQVLLDFADSE